MKGMIIYMKEILVKSSIDGSMQPSLFHKATGNGKRPLLVGLHTWSADRFNQQKNMLPLAEELGWNLLLPEFRGPNLCSNPIGKEACGSVLAKQDIVDAVEYVLANHEIDDKNIYLLGGSGGGHMALLMAAYKPMLWKAVAAFCPITELSKWYYENPHYTPHIHYCCGGEPEGEHMDEYVKRSPISYIDQIAKSNTKIFHGRYDKSVPFTHSLNLYYELSNKYPQARVFLDIFDGGHELRLDEAKRWFLSQSNLSSDMLTTGQDSNRAGNRGNADSNNNNGNFSGSRNYELTK